MFNNNIIRSVKPNYEIPDISVGALVLKTLRQLNGENVCLINGSNGTKLTINELIIKSNSIAMALIERGINKSDIVLTFAENSIELSIVLFASMLLGITLYPITPIANVYEMQSLLETMDSITIFTTKTKTEIISKVVNKEKNKINVKNIIVLDGVYNNYLTFDQLVKEGENQSLDTIPYFDVSPKEDIFVLLQSSGTTGVPKSVMISHKAFVGGILSVNEYEFERIGQPVFGHITPFGSISGITFLFGFICSGVPIVIYKEYNEELILESIEKYKISFMLILPKFGHKLIYEQFVDKYDLSSLNFGFTAGTAFPKGLAKAIMNKYKVLFQEVYGMTEFGSLSMSSDIKYSDYIPGNLGSPGPNTEMKVINLNTGESVGPGIDGELCVRGPRLFSGYLNNVLATNEAIDSEGWLRTGDVGHYDQNNRFFITDRIKELIKFGTKQVSPTELELFLLSHKCVAEVAVVGVRHETDTQWPRAYVKTKDNMSVTEEELKKFVSDSLSESKQLRAGVVFIDTIPRTAIGKVNRRYFKQLIKDELIKN